MKGKLSTFLMILGCCCMAAALCLFLYNKHLEKQAAQNTEKVLLELGKIIPQETTPESTDEIDKTISVNDEIPYAEIEGGKYIGIIDIPACGLSLPVLSAWSYPNLKLAPCRYTGTPEKGNLVIAAHNYDAHFGNLHLLNPKDQIIFTDITGKNFLYEVELTQTIQPKQIEKMTDSDYELTLFTCNYSGRVRIAVRCRLIKIAENEVW